MKKRMCCPWATNSTFPTAPPFTSAPNQHIYSNFHHISCGEDPPSGAAWVLLGLCSYPRGISTPPSPPEPEEAIMKLTGDKTSHRGTVGHLSFSNAVLFLPIWLQLVQRYNFQCCSFLVDHTIKVFEKQTAPNHGTVRSPFSNLWPIFPEQTQSCIQGSQKARAERQELLFNVIT